MVPIEYVRSQCGKHLYRCRKDGRRLVNSLKGGTRHCDTLYWQDPTEEIRLFGVIRRGSNEWNVLYVKQWAVEQFFKTLKQARRIESHCLRGLQQINLQALMSTLTFQVTVLVNLQAGNLAGMRWMVLKVA
jgi:hypothetical protein